MNDLIIFFIIIVSFCLGYYMGKRKPEDDIPDLVELARDIIKDKPKPGVVRHLTDEEIAEKKNPAMRGNKESFDRFFATHPPINI